MIKQTSKPSNGLTMERSCLLNQPISLHRKTPPIKIHHVPFNSFIIYPFNSIIVVISTKYSDCKDHKQLVHSQCLLKTNGIIRIYFEQHNIWDIKQSY